MENNSKLSYNVIARWQYERLPEALGCQDWYTKRVVSNIELEAALREARERDGPCYIEVVLDGELMEPMRSSALEREYQVAPPSNIGKWR